jgi:hypothetical protein
MRYTISADAAFAAVEDGAVVLHMGTKRYYSLNETGAFVWQRLEDGAGPSHIVAQIVERYEVGRSEAEMAVSRLIEELKSEELVRLAESP